MQNFLDIQLKYSFITWLALMFFIFAVICAWQVFSSQAKTSKRLKFVLKTLEKARKRTQVAKQNILKLEASLQELQKRLQDSELKLQIKSEQFAATCHELRNPLSAMLGFAEVLATGQTANNEMNQHAKVIARNCNHLIHLLDESLDFAKLEAGKFELEMVETNLLELINETLALFRVKASEKHLVLNLHIDFAVPEKILTDSKKLRQILINLLSNAIKFTEKGIISLSVIAVPQEKSTDFAQIENISGADVFRIYFDLSDTGVGLEFEKMKLLFQPFQQADNSTARRFGGTGLGMFVSRQFAVSLGGDLGIASSRVGQGSSFTFNILAQSLPNLPVLPTLQTERNVMDTFLVHSNSLCKKTILIVDDADDNVFLLTRVLLSFGAEVISAKNGKEAVELISAVFDTEKLPFLADGKKIDAVLMDLQMPIMDGKTATIALRKIGIQLPIVALTAHTLASERENCLQIGFNGYLQKPIQKQELVATLLEVCAANKSNNILRSDMTFFAQETSLSN